jgi:predicted O-linked N-acetylglucosamine transferase (SPINDLY family)
MIFKRFKKPALGEDRDNQAENAPELISTDELKSQGDAHLKEGRLDDAAGCYVQILAREKGHADALTNLGYIRKEQGRKPEARECLEQALKLAGSNADAHYLLATIQGEEGELDEALVHLAAALSERPEFELAHRDRIVMLVRLGRSQDAGRACEEGLARCPDSADLHYFRSNLYRLANDPNAAIVSCEEALRCDPLHRGARRSLTHLLLETYQVEKALASSLAEIQTNPESADAFHQAAMALSFLERAPEAIPMFARAIALAPDRSALAYLGLGHAYHASLDLAAAETAYAKAVTLSPQNPELHNALGYLLYERGSSEAALASFKKAVALDPEDALARWSCVMLQAPAYADSVEDAARARARFVQELIAFEAWWEKSDADGASFVGKIHPFFLSYQEENNRPLQERYGAICAHAMRRWLERQAFDLPLRPKGERIRIGIVSADIREHSVWAALTQGWIEHLDRTRFEVGIFSLSMVKDEASAWAQEHSDYFVSGPKTLLQWVAAIRSENPAILLYPAVGLEEKTLQLAALRLANVQINAWGHPETSGLPTLDYFLSAQCFEPEHAHANYSETLVALPHLGSCYRPRRLSAMEPDLAKLGLDPTRALLICPGTPFKYQPGYDAILVEIAGKLPGAQFVFFRPPTADIAAKVQARLKNAFQKARLDYDASVRFVPWQSPAAFHALLRRADVLLDTIGFSGYNGAIQAIECGLPVITCEGRFLRGRLASGILRRLDLAELIAPTTSDYVGLAARVVLDRDFRRAMCEAIVARRDRLFEDLAPIREFEEFLVRSLSERRAPPAG